MPFCYQARGILGPYDTQLAFSYSIKVKDQAENWVPSGYIAVGYVKVTFVGPSDLRCAVVKTDPNAPVRHFSCLTSSVRPISGSANPQPRWTVTTAAIPPGSPAVYFLGDSVTAGFGYCGAEGGADSSNIINCPVNQPFLNAWTGTNSL